MPADAPQWLTNPDYWLAIALPWDSTAGPIQEAAVVIAPPIVPWERLPHAATTVLAACHTWHRHTSDRVILPGDLTGIAHPEGRDPFAALAHLTDHEAGTPSMLLTITERTHRVVRDIDHHVSRAGHPSTSDLVSETERRLVRTLLEHRLEEDWPPYIQELIANGALTTRAAPEHFDG